MADEQQEVRRINWNEVLAVTHVFKSFRMSIHLGKLALALVAILLIGLWGWGMDAVTGVSGLYVPTGEIYEHARLSEAEFADWQKKADEKQVEDIAKLWDEAHAERNSLSAFLTRLRSQGGAGGHFEEALKALRQDANQPKEQKARDKAEADPLGALEQVEDIFDGEVARIEDLIDRSAAEDAAQKRIKDDPTLDTQEKKDEARTKLAADVDAARRALTRRKIKFAEALRKIRGSTIFDAVTEFECRCLRSALVAVRQGNFTGGLTAYRELLDRRAAMLPEAEALQAVPAAPPAAANEPAGFLFWLLMSMHGLCWLIGEHWLYAVVFLAVALAIWALFGGAIHRIAALHFAREEKISMSQALKFSASKFFSYYTAPLIPLAIVVVIGLLMMAGGLILGSWGGGIPMGALFPLALVGGLLIAFLLFGLVGGGALMYPTIAVESSDSFDAISRSYSYVFGKPWRAGFYGVVALVYGVICYLFVRLFAYVALASTHSFVGMGVVGGGQTVSATADKLDVLWPAPTYNRLMSTTPWEAMSGWEAIGSACIWFWVMLVAALVGAFLLSYFSSASTVIYFLLRRKVDATDLDDVYVEEPEEEIVPPEAPAGEGEEETPAAEAEGEAPAKPKRTRKKAAKKAKKAKPEGDEEASDEKEGDSEE